MAYPSGYKNRSAYRALSNRLRAAQLGYRIGKQLRMAYSYRKGQSNTRTTQKRGSNGQGVTSQYDKTMIYRKRYMPRRRKRRWVKFVRKVNAVSKQGLGTKTVIVNNQVTTSFLSSDQTLAYCHLYSFKGVQSTPNNETPCNDLERIFNRDDLGEDAKVYFKSAIMDITFNGYPPDTADDSPMEVDVYLLQYRAKQFPGSFNSLLTLAETSTTTMPQYSAGLTLGSRGATPFDLPQLGRIGVKIMKKTKYFLSPGAPTFTYQIRDPKNRFMTGAQLSTESAFTEGMKGGWTQTLLFIIKAIPGHVPIQGAGVQIGCTRKYSYVNDENSQVQDGQLI